MDSSPHTQSEMQVCWFQEVEQALQIDEVHNKLRISTMQQNWVNSFTKWVETQFF
jgi:hypothetical protein